jgi:hypothetical protein
MNVSGWPHRPIGFDGILPKRPCIAPAETASCAHSRVMGGGHHRANADMAIVPIATKHRIRLDAALPVQG